MKRPTTRYPVVYKAEEVIEYVPRFAHELALECEKVRLSVIHAIRFIEPYKRHGNKSVQCSMFMCLQLLYGLEMNFYDKLPRDLADILARASYISEHIESKLSPYQTSHPRLRQACFCLRYGRSPRKKDMSFSFGSKRKKGSNLDPTENQEITTEQE